MTTNTPSQPSPETLQPEHAIHLLQRQDTLQHEAQTVLDETRTHSTIEQSGHASSGW